MPLLFLFLLILSLKLQRVFFILPLPLSLILKILVLKHVYQHLGPLLVFGEQLCERILFRWLFQNLRGRLDNYRINVGDHVALGLRDLLRNLIQEHGQDAIEVTEGLPVCLTEVRRR